MVARWPVEGPALLASIRGIDARRMFRGIKTLIDVKDLSCVGLWRTVRPLPGESSVFVDSPSDLGVFDEAFLIKVGNAHAGVATWSPAHPRRSRLLSAAFDVPLVLSRVAGGALWRE